ncbi:MAG TPA: response regulator transcription factor [Ktedonosporobacter sp.]|nr:response regulator transcription factor [Ktedonosporobacter sp.]
MTARITILIVDDHPIVRQSMRAFLDVQPDLNVIGEAESGAQAVLLARESLPAVVLMDLTMPGMNGVEATQALKQVSPRSQVIVLTSSYEHDFIKPALQAGAISYILKDIRSRELAEAIRKAARGEAVLPAHIARSL